jgi:4-diphosphocytidyl-2-C-methyl-D-erythritol kinase
VSLAPGPSPLTESAPAKINLTLRVLGRRADGYHELESLVAFADLADRLNLSPDEEMAVELDGPFAEACGPPADNLVLRAARAAGLPAGRFRLEKHIPVAAGLGGGSADAAASLRMIARANGLSAGDPRILAAARATGADVPVCLDARARVVRGTGQDLSAALALPELPALLVNPGLPLSTAEVFARFAATVRGAVPIDRVPLEKNALLAWLAAHGNDLTQAAKACVPAIAEVLSALEALPGSRIARMSGAGATCFALFDDRAAAAAAAKQLSRERGNWWICPATLG